MFILCCLFDKKLELHLVVVSILFNKGLIWARQKYCAQNWYTDFENSEYQSLPAKKYWLILTLFRMGFSGAAHGFCGEGMQKGSPG